ncbi:nucleoside hydrolase, partial [Aeromonas caviae]|uniref:nucleoside hydrolase n=1 Tax=Aeromonas caviae TaxID=648 RepID=UPI001CC55459
MTHKIILDTDPGIDDAMAILFAEAHPAIDLLAITTVFGNATIENGTRNALWLKQKYGSSRDPGKVEVDRQGAGKLVVAKHTTTITLLSPCIIL